MAQHQFLTADGGIKKTTEHRAIRKREEELSMKSPSEVVTRFATISTGVLQIISHAAPTHKQFSAPTHKQPSGLKSEVGEGLCSLSFTVVSAMKASALPSTMQANDVM